MRSLARIALVLAALLVVASPVLSAPAPDGPVNGQAEMGSDVAWTPVHAAKGWFKEPPRQRDWGWLGGVALLLVFGVLLGVSRLGGVARPTGRDRRVSVGVWGDSFGIRRGACRLFQYYPEDLSSKNRSARSKVVGY